MPKPEDASFYPINGVIKHYEDSGYIIGDKRPDGAVLFMSKHILEKEDDLCSGNR